jgi:hypothetical protein
MDKMPANRIKGIRKNRTERKSCLMNLETIFISCAARGNLIHPGMWIPHGFDGPGVGGGEDRFRKEISDGREQADYTESAGCP